MFLFTECNKPTAITGATFTPDLSKYNHGLKLKFTCNDDTHTSSGTSEVTGNEGSVTKIDFKCHQSMFGEWPWF